MTVSAAATISVLMIAVGFVVIVVAVATVAAAAFAAEHVQYILYFLKGGLAVLQYFSREVQGFACQRMVGVDGHTVGVNAFHFGQKTVVILIGQRNDGSWSNILMVEVTVNTEYLAFQCVHTLGLIGAETLFG